MRGFGVVVLVLGVLIIGGALIMDVSVSTGMGRVNNLGLMSERQNYTTIGGVLLIAGLLMILFGGRRLATQYAAPDAESRPCPACAEPIQAAAIKCKHCGENIQPVGSARLIDGWVATIPCLEGTEQIRAVEAITALGLPAVPMECANVAAGPFFTKEEAKRAVSRLAKEHKLFANVDYRESGSGKYPPLPE